MLHPLLNTVKTVVTSAIIATLAKLLILFIVISFNSTLISWVGLTSQSDLVVVLWGWGIFLPAFGLRLTSLLILL